MLNKDELLKQAKAEVQEELFREAVDKEKERIRAVRWWHNFIPWKIIIIRR